MKTTLIACLLCFTLLGCATYKGAGSEFWYNQRMAEIEQMRTDKKITDAEYINAKNEVDKIRVGYLRRDSGYPTTSVGVGWWM